VLFEIVGDGRRSVPARLALILDVARDGSWPRVLHASGGGADSATAGGTAVRGGANHTLWNRQQHPTRALAWRLAHDPVLESTPRPFGQSDYQWFAEGRSTVAHPRARSAPRFARWVVERCNTREGLIATRIAVDFDTGAFRAFSAYDVPAIGEIAAIAGHCVISSHTHGLDVANYIDSFGEDQAFGEVREVALKIGADTARGQIGLAFLHILHRMGQCAGQFNNTRGWRRGPGHDRHRHRPDQDLGGDGGAAPEPEYAPSEDADCPEDWESDPILSFAPVIDILPEPGAVPLPSYAGDAELAEVRGTNFGDTMAHWRDNLANDYRAYVSMACAARRDLFGNCAFPAWLWASATIKTRGFRLSRAQVVQRFSHNPARNPGRMERMTTDVFAPLADLLNHEDGAPSLWLRRDRVDLAVPEHLTADDELAALTENGRVPVPAATGAGTGDATSDLKSTTGAENSITVNADGTTTGNPGPRDVASPRRMARLLAPGPYKMLSVRGVRGAGKPLAIRYVGLHSQEAIMSFGFVPWVAAPRDAIKVFVPGTPRGDLRQLQRDQLVAALSASGPHKIELTGEFGAGIMVEWMLRHTADRWELDAIQRDPSGGFNDTLFLVAMADANNHLRRAVAAAPPPAVLWNPWWRKGYGRFGPISERHGLLRHGVWLEVMALSNAITTITSELLSEGRRLCRAHGELCDMPARVTSPLARLPRGHWKRGKKKKKKKKQKMETKGKAAE
jgi:hypothetical protein